MIDLTRREGTIAVLVLSRLLPSSCLDHHQSVLATSAVFVCNTKAPKDFRCHKRSELREHHPSDERRQASAPAASCGGEPHHNAHERSDLFQCPARRLYTLGGRRLRPPSSCVKSVSGVFARTTEKRRHGIFGDWVFGWV